VLSFVKADGAWRVLDVANGVMFRSRDGHGATADDVAADPAFAAAQGPAVYRGVPYAALFDGFRAPIPPDLTRADMQVPGARTWFAIKRWLGSGGRQWEMRPASPAQMTPRVLITGGTGLLGQALLHSAPNGWEVAATFHRQSPPNEWRHCFRALDVSDEAAVLAAVSQFQPTVVDSHRVDRERRPRRA
jgi:hypothetical protein